MHPPYAGSVEELISLIDSGVRPQYFFWGHTPTDPEQVDPSCLSNWFPAAFTVDGHTYPTTEHFMMAEKARLFNDPVARARILTASSPDAAIKFGREVSGFDEETWRKHRCGILDLFAGEPRKGVPFSQSGYYPEHFDGLLTVSDLLAVTAEWEPLAERKSVLIRKKAAGKANAGELKELAELKRLSAGRLDLFAPLPLAAAEAACRDAERMASIAATGAICPKAAAPCPIPAATPSPVVSGFCPTAELRRSTSMARF